MNLLRLVHLLLAGIFLIPVVGCSFSPSEPEVSGPITPTVASKRQGRIRSRFGPMYSSNLQLESDEFSANWELGNAFKKDSRMQIRPPADWSLGRVYQALQLVLDDTDHKPWYEEIDETVLRLFRLAADDQTSVETDLAPDTPYLVSAKVRHQGTEWFVQIRVQILDEDGNALGI